MGSTVGVRVYTTTRIALGANLDIRSIGFAPKVVKVVNLTNAVKAEWNDSLADGYAVKEAANGDRSVVTSLGFTPLVVDSNGNPGIRLGALVDVNDTTTEELLFECYG